MANFNCTLLLLPSIACTASPKQEVHIYRQPQGRAASNKHVTEWPAPPLSRSISSNLFHCLNLPLRVRLGQKRSYGIGRFKASLKWCTTRFQIPGPSITVANDTFLRQKLLQTDFRRFTGRAKGKTRVPLNSISDFISEYVECILHFLTSWLLQMEACVELPILSVSSLPVAIAGRGRRSCSLT